MELGFGVWEAAGPSAREDLSVQGLGFGIWETIAV